MKRAILAAGTLCALAACLLLQAPAQAAINPMISFQGKLTNPDGTNVTDNSYSIRFRIYTDPSADTGSCANTCKWEETQGSVAVSGGLFHVNLGSSTTLPGGVDFNGSALYLGIKVGSDAEMTPRVRLTAVPYAFNSDTLDGLDSGAFVQLSPGAQQTGNINVSGTITSGGAVNGISIGSTIQPSASGALTLQSNGANALTLTSGAAATWSTTAGALTVQGFGGLNLNTPATNTSTTHSSNVNISTGNATGTTSNSGSITIDVGTATGTMGTITIGHSGVSTTISGTLAVSQGLSANGGLALAANQGLTMNSGTGVFAQTFASGANASAQTLSVTNSNSGGSSIAVNAHDITLVGTATSGGTNTNTALRFINPSAAANNVFYALNFTGTGYTDILRVNGSQIINGSGVLQSAGLSGTYSNALTLSNASNAFTGSTYNGLTLTSAADGLTIAGGTTSRTLTVTGANITVGSTIQPTAAGALTVQSNGANALTLTSGAAATWSTSAGLLTVSGTGGITLSTPNTSGASSAITLQSGNSSAGTAANVSLDTGTTSTGTPTINLGASNAKAIQLGNNTSNPGITIDSGTGTIGIGTGAQARAVNLATGGAAQAVTIGSSNGASALDLQAGTGGVDITSQGTGAINIGNNAIAQTVNIGNGTGATTVAVLCGTGACGFGNNAVAHTTTVGSTTGTATTILQAGTGGLSLTSGGNIVLGTSDTTGTLLVLDTKTGTGDPTGVNGGMYYNSANSKFRCHQASVWSDCISGFNTNSLAADQAATQSSTTMQNVTALGFAANANTTYVFDAWIPVNDSNTTADLKYTWTTPAGATLNIMTEYYSSATANVICNITTSGTACANTTINLANHFMRARGQVTNGGTAGTIQFQFAQNTSTAASFPVIKKGAVITWRQSN